MYNRHDLVWMSTQGREEACAFSLEHSPQLDPIEVKNLLLDPAIPAIVRRQEEAHPGLLEVGFSSCKFQDGVRFRVASEVPEAQIIRWITPFDVPEAGGEDFPYSKLLEQVLEAGNAVEVQVGLYGSAALQLVTGRPYLRPGSDLDVFVRAAHGGLRTFWERAKALEEQWGVRLDVEADLGNGYGAKLRELLSSQRTVLAKGFSDVLILDKEQAAHLL